MKVEVDAGKNSNAIYIDSKYVADGKAILNLPLGKHFILIKEDLYKWDASIISDSILISECNKVYSFNYALDKKILVDSKPQDAAVFNGYELVGYTPNYIENKYPSLALTKRNELVTVDIKDLNSPVLFRNGIPKTNGSFTNTDLFKILMGSAVILGGAAAYFKIHADSRYDEYKRSKDSSTMDEVKQLDLYSGLALGALQINFGYLLYRFLAD